MSRRTIILTWVAALLLSAPLHAQIRLDDAPAIVFPAGATLTPRPHADLFAPEKAPDVKQLVIYFVALVALAGGGFYFLKHGLPFRSARGAENRLQLLETKMLGNRQFLVVVKYQDNKMLLGVGPGMIQLLCPLDSADDDLERLLKEEVPAPGPAAV